MPLFRNKEEHSKLNHLIGGRIKAAREERQMTQEEVGEKIQMSRVNISNLERGEVDIAADVLTYLSYVVEKPITYFYPADSRGATLASLSDKEAELYLFIRKIGDEDRENKVIDLLIEQAYKMAEVIIDSDVALMRDNAEKEFQKIKAMGGWKKYVESTKDNISPL